jgi:hypothetical protein
MAVNATGRNPAQESGLVNFGWYGKFHIEMAFWHMGYLALFNKMAPPETMHINLRPLSSKCN